MAKPTFLACDWGTTNLRAALVDDAGRAIRWKSFPFGVSKLGRGEAPVKFRTEVRPALGAENLPALLCGMVGSTLGWTVVPYQPCPANLGTLLRGLVQVEPGPAGAWIVPGVMCSGIAGAPDVMRGEETQILGWVAEDEGRQSGRHIICHPGTHAKWAIVEDGSLVRFITAMTGELYDVLRKHSVLATSDAAEDEEAFDEGVTAAGDGGALAARLFTARSRVVAGGRPAATTASYLSGLLIGAEIAALPRLLEPGPRQVPALIGDPALCRWYAHALDRAGFAFTQHSGEEAALAGLKALYAERPSG